MAMNILSGRMGRRYGEDERIERKQKEKQKEEEGQEKYRIKEIIRKEKK